MASRFGDAFSTKARPCPSNRRFDSQVLQVFFLHSAGEEGIHAPLWRGAMLDQGCLITTWVGQSASVTTLGDLCILSAYSEAFSFGEVTSASFCTDLTVCYSRVDSNSASVWLSQIQCTSYRRHPVESWMARITLYMDMLSPTSNHWRDRLTRLNTLSTHHSNAM